MMAAHAHTAAHTILVLDVDGTLRGPGEPIGSGVAEFLREQARKGVGIVPCSGKSADVLGELFHRLEVPILAIGAENGGHIVYDPRGSARNEVCRVDGVALFEAREHLDQCPKCNSWINEESKRTIITRRFGNPARAAEKAEMWRNHVGRLPYFCERQIEVYIYPGDTAVDLVVDPRNVRKELVIRFLRTRHPQARFVVAGDGLNDLSMMTAPQVVPVCPANAVPEIKEAVWRQGGVIAQAPYGAGTVEAIRMVFSWDEIAARSESAPA